MLAALFIAAVAQWQCDPENDPPCMPELGSPCTAPCPEVDVDGDQYVTVADLTLVLENWGPVFGPNNTADVNCDATVDCQDLIKVIAAWGCWCDPCT